jgi:hypothetical protein
MIGVTTPVNSETSRSGRWVRFSTCLRVLLSRVAFAIARRIWLDSGWSSRDRLASRSCALALWLTSSGAWTRPSR